LYEELLLILAAQAPALAPGEVTTDVSCLACEPARASLCNVCWLSTKLLPLFINVPFGDKPPKTPQ